MAATAAAAAATLVLAPKRTIPGTPPAASLRSSSLPRTTSPSPLSLLPFFKGHRLSPLRASTSQSPNTAHRPLLSLRSGASSTPQPPNTFSFPFWVLLSLSSAFLWLLLTCAGAAAAGSIRASKFGLEVARALQRSGWPDEAVVFALATLPVIELRGAIPVGYWMRLHPLRLTALAVLGNMVPVPFILLYLKKLCAFVAGKNASMSRFLDLLFERAKGKAGPVEEFQWLGLMLFVAVPFPGTGAWTGAVVASILDMPFWSAISANFFGVVSAGLLVNLLVNLGLKYAVATGLILFIISTVMWSFLRFVKKSLSSS